MKRIFALVSFLLFATSSVAAPLNIIGFETGDFGEIDSVTNGSIQTTTKRTGSYALRINPTGAATGRATVACLTTTGFLTDCNATTAYIRVYFAHLLLPAANYEQVFRVNGAGSLPKMFLAISSTGILSAYDRSSNLMDTGTTVLASGTFYRIECLIPNSVSGSYSCLLNGVTEMASGSHDFRAINTASIALGKQANLNSNSIDFYYDDYALDDAAFPGAGNIIRLIPNGDGSTQQWTVGTGASDYTQVNQVVEDGTKYIRNNTVVSQLGLVKYPTTASLGISGNIYAAKHWVRVSEGVGSATTSFHIRVKSGATNDDTTGVDIGGTSRVYFGKVYGVDPNTSLPWTLSSLDIIESGVLEDNASPDKASQITMMVDYNAPNQSRSAPQMLGVGN